MSDALERRLRIEDVARAAGVSTITASRALGNPGRVSDATRLRVEQAAAEIGYVVNGFASSLKTGRSPIIPFFVSNLQNAHFANAVQGAQDALEGERYHLLMAQTGYSERVERTMLQQVQVFRPAAMMFTGMVRSPAMKAQLRALDIPIMEMWDFSADPIDMLVGFSNAGGGQLVGEHLATAGYRHIAYAGRTRDRGAQRLSGFRRGLHSHGLAPALVLPLDGKLAPEDGEAALDAVLAAVPNCDAIFFATDLLAIGAEARARALGLGVPDDIALAGFGDLPETRRLPTPLTTVRVASYDMGLAAGRMVAQRLRGEAVEPASVRFPISLEVRASTGS